MKIKKYKTVFDKHKCEYKYIIVYGHKDFDDNFKIKDQQF